MCVLLVRILSSFITTKCALTARQFLMCRSTPSCATLHRHVPLYTVMCHSTPSCAALHRHVPLYTVMCRSTPWCAALHRHVPLYTVMCHSTPWCAALHRHLIYDYRMIKLITCILQIPFGLLQATASCRKSRQGCKDLFTSYALTGVLISPLPDLLPDVFCLMVRIFRLMLVLLYI